jgi:IS30 family transposase
LQQKEITAITREINDRPLACLDYLTPAERFAEAVAAS